MIRSLWSLIVGLGLPLVAVIVVVPLISNTRVLVAGIPLLFLWLFLWFPLTTVCLGIAWYVFDRPLYERDGSRNDR